MGTLQQDFVNAVITEYDEDKKQIDELNKFVAEHDDICVKLDSKANGYVNYFMGWDGSKEGWETSDKYDIIREQFIKLIKAIRYSKIYHVVDGDFYDEPVLRCLTDVDDLPQQSLESDSGKQ